MSLDECARRYREDLLEDTLPFWVEHAPDAEHGGFFSSLARDGAVFDTDKSIWVQGRFTWLLASVVRGLPDHPQAERWRELMRGGIEFLDRFGFNADGTMRFTVTREGRHLRTRRYAFSECFTALAYGLGGAVEGDRDRMVLAADLLAGLDDRARSFPSKTDTNTRPMRGLGLPMIQLHVAQELRDALPADVFEEVELDVAAHVDAQVDAIRLMWCEEEQCLLEAAAPDGGSLFECTEGRTLNPGHAIEACWFLLREAEHRLASGREDGADLRAFALRALEATWERGWDTEHGGLLYFVDALGKPVGEYWHDMKFWWPHNEAVLATLYAHRAAPEDPRWLERHSTVHQWAHDHFPDPEGQEWFGYLARDGRRTSDAKGNLWKGPYHIPRMQWFGSRLLTD